MIEGVGTGKGEVPVVTSGWSLEIAAGGMVAHFYETEKIFAKHGTYMYSGTILSQTPLGQLKISTVSSFLGRVLYTSLS